MSDTTERDRLAGARQQGQAQFDSIREMVEELRKAAAGDDKTGDIDDGRYYDAQDRIHEDALSVEVRSDWYAPGDRDADNKPAEYRILLCTGGPAVQLTGELSTYGEPETCRMQVQDWFTPWTDFRPVAPASQMDYESAAMRAGWECRNGAWYWGETLGPIVSAQAVCAEHNLDVVASYDSEPTLLAYAQQFYFGE